MAMLVDLSFSLSVFFVVFDYLVNFFSYFLPLCVRIVWPADFSLLPNAENIKRHDETHDIGFQ